jgi:leucyl aminopeptidase
VSRGLPRVEPLPGALPETTLAAVLASASAAVAIGVRQGDGRDGTKRPSAARGSAALARQVGVDVAGVGAAEHAGTAAGDLTRVPSVAWSAKVFLVGVGEGSPRELRTAAAALARSVRRVDRILTSLGAGVGAAGAQAVAEGFLLGAYRVAREGTKADGGPRGAGLVQLVGASAEAVRRGVTDGGATVLARELANTRSSTKGPSWVAARARRLAHSHGLRERVWSEADLRREGFGGLLAVGGGAERGPRLVQLDYAPTRTAGVRPPHVVLVGKGITFDTGGISLKPREAMLGMTTDMTGAAVVLAVLAACRDDGVRAQVTGLLPLAENAIGAASYRPGDVVRMYDGTTVEVRNTDAEGRMVLADALGFARTRLHPDALVDIATLTGAATQSLGRTHAALYATSDRLAAGLQRAGEAAGERLWRMPLVEDYRELIDSDVADICQIATRPQVGAGSVMAALFLREFAGDLPWAHLDIAGPGRSDRDKGEVNRGGTGFGARALLRWLATIRRA